MIHVIDSPLNDRNLTYMDTQDEKGVYDFKSVQEWLKDGLLPCPNCGLKVQNRDKCRHKRWRRGVIYRLRSPMSLFVYVGQTLNPERRRLEHKEMHHSTTRAWPVTQPYPDKWRMEIIQLVEARGTYRQFELILLAREARCIASVEDGKALNQNGLRWNSIGLKKGQLHCPAFEPEGPVEYEAWKKAVKAAKQALADQRFQLSPKYVNKKRNTKRWKDDHRDEMNAKRRKIRAEAKEEYKKQRDDDDEEAVPVSLQ